MMRHQSLRLPLVLFLTNLSFSSLYCSLPFELHAKIIDIIEKKRGRILKFQYNKFRN
jgi:hypothetical protein